MNERKKQKQLDEIRLHLEISRDLLLGFETPYTEMHELIMESITNAIHSVDETYQMYQILIER